MNVILLSYLHFHFVVNKMNIPSKNPHKKTMNLLSPYPSVKSVDMVLGLTSFRFYKPDILKSKLKHFPSKENVIKYLSFSREKKFPSVVNYWFSKFSPWILFFQWCYNYGYFLINYHFPVENLSKNLKREKLSFPINSST